jgi:hypothetical protein
MLSILKQPQDGKKLYTFGKITRRLGNGRYELSFKNNSVTVDAYRHIEINTWIRIYGTYKDGCVRARFVEKLGGLDINLLERAVSYITQKINSF